jgi:ribosome-associated protein
MKKIDFLKLARRAAQVADDKKGRDIVILNVRRLTTVANYFLIVTADSAPQMNAILDTIHDTLREEEGIKPVRREGKDSASWTVLDYGGLVIHAMSPASRTMYNLERIWADAKKVK